MLLPPLAAGVLLGVHLDISTGVRTGGYIALLLLCLVATACCKRLPAIMLPLFCCIFFAAGALRSVPAGDSPVAGESYRLSGTCTEQLAPQRYLFRSGRVTLFLSLPDSAAVYRVGERLSVTGRIMALKRGHDVNEFDYDRYLWSLGADYRLAVSGEQLKSIQREGDRFSLFGMCQQVRGRATGKLREILPDTMARSLVQGICLGDRRTIPEEVMERFRNSGTIHTLAVSGLHMGAVFVLLTGLLQVLGIRRRGFRLFIIPCLWLFAGITGLSPSACRAATILTFITVGDVFQRDYLPLNALAASAFFTLLVAPRLLFTVSFQLSYAAYAGIIVGLPILPGNGHSGKSGVAKKQWYTLPLSSLAVSLAAQVGTLPLLAYHFHTIPLNSLIANLFIIPLATLLLYAGLALLLFPGWTAPLLVYPIRWIVSIQLALLKGFERIRFSWEGLYPGELFVGLIYLFMVIACIYLYSRERRWITAGLCLLVAAGGVNGWERYHRQRKVEVVVFDRYRYSQVLFNYRGHALWLANGDTLQRTLPYITAHRLLEHPPGSRTAAGQEVVWNGQQLQTAGCDLEILHRKNRRHNASSFVIVTGNIYPHQVEWNTPLPRSILADRSGPPTCIRQWEQWCREQGIAFTYTGETGHRIIPLR